MGKQLTLTRYEPDGRPDRRFGTQGMVTTQAPADIQVYDFRVDPRGSLVAVGRAHAREEGQIALVRWLPDGRLDARFGNGGTVLTDFTAASTERGLDVAFYPSGRIVAAGGAVVDGDTRFALARYNRDGSLDTRFGQGGMVLTDILATTQERIQAVVIDDRGRVVVSGLARPPARHQFPLARYNWDGTPDGSLGGTGVVLIDFPTSTNEWVKDIAIDTGDRIVLVGSARPDDPRGWRYSLSFALARCMPDGKPDTSFGDNGQVLTKFRDLYSSISSITLDDDGRLIVAGTALADDELQQFAVARYRADGTLDTTFGGDGQVTTRFPPANRAQAFRAFVDRTGGIVAAGYAWTADELRLHRDHIEGRLALARYNPDGSLDQKYGHKGTVLTDGVPGAALPFSAMDWCGGIVSVWSP